MTKRKQGEHNYRGPNKTHVVRILTIRRGNSKELYGITIPYKYVKKYKLFHKKFKIEITKRGKFIIHTQVK